MLLTIAVRLPSWWSTGLWLTFTPHADSLVGRAEVYADNSPNGPTRAAVIGIPVACPVLSRVGQVGVQSLHAVDKGTDAFTRRRDIARALPGVELSPY